MRIIKVSDITNKVEEMLLDANYNINNDIIDCIKNRIKDESSPLGKIVLNKIVENDNLAKEMKLPICQDTGVVVCFLEVGYNVCFDGDIYEAINEGVRKAYTKGYLRKSVVKHPLDRINTKDNSPAIVHVKFVNGDKLKIHVAPKGGGSENMSLVKMLIPADGVDGVKKLVLDTVFNGGGKPCPPVIVGIGLGGNLEKSALMAKEALLRDLNDINPDPILANLEKELVEEINQLGVGPMGFGGTVTCLGVKINSYPCHIASLPVAINIQCHAARHKSCIM